MEIRENAAFFPASYRPILNLRETEEAIVFIKAMFQERLARALHLARVSAPLFVSSRTGINDHLSGVEKPVRFRVKAIGEEAEVVQSLAKWKRKALADYAFTAGEGLYTDMNAIRPDEQLDNTHSVYVDQWDWERILLPSDRNLDFLKSIVRSIYGVIRETETAVCDRYPGLGRPQLPESIPFIHSEELEARFPELRPRDREHALLRERGAAFVIGLGWPLSDGNPHDARAADYDDWSAETPDGRHGLNGDLLVWNPALDRAFELSSMGIRVSPESLVRQLEMKNETHKLEFDFHKKLIHGQLPLTIGGGIGQSRLCMFFLRKAHIGEVQSSVWPEEVILACREKGVRLL
jgi:aspartate--ammonia ligase